MWLHFAHRPLKLIELQHALAVEKSHTEFDVDNIPSKNSLLNCCLGLVVIDDETLTVRFMHYTLEEYFHKHAGEDFPDGYSSIAETCLIYLNFGELRQHCTNLASLVEKEKKYAFLQYAALYWGTYIKQHSNDGLTELVKVIVDHEIECSPCAIQALYQHLYFRIGQKFSGIHVIAYFGLSEVMAYFCEVERNMELEDDLNRTPLSWAAENGHEAVVRLLIERDGININAKDRWGRTALTWAAEEGHEAVVRLLVEREDVDINAKDHSGQTPLSLAAENGNEAVARLLIERDDVDINSRDTSGKTPFSWAAQNGNETVVRLLIERDDVDINSKNHGGQTALSLAAKYGHDAVVQLLNDRLDRARDSNTVPTPF